MLPDFYKRTYDPFVSCSVAAASTTTLEVGTGICLLALRDTVHTAKQVASVDHLSGGRFTFGIGFGWNADEFVTHGVDFRTRHRRVREQVQMLKAMWTEDVASFEGEFVQLQPSWCWPKPVQQPHPKIYLGGSGPVTMRHAAEWADVWYPTPPVEDPTLERALPAFRRLLEANGRGPESVAVGVAPAAVDGSLLAIYRDIGVSHVNVYCGGDTRDETLAALDQLSAVRDQVLTP